MERQPHYRYRHPDQLRDSTCFLFWRKKFYDCNILTENFMKITFYSKVPALVFDTYFKRETLVLSWDYSLGFSVLSYRAVLLRQHQCWIGIDLRQIIQKFDFFEKILVRIFSLIMGFWPQHEEEFYLREHQKFAKNCFKFGEFCHFVLKGSKSVNQILICSKCRHHSLFLQRKMRFLSVFW